MPLLLSLAAANAADWYVGPTGDTATIAEAFDAAESGDIVHVEAGTYAETLTADKNLTLVADGAVVLEPEQGGETVLWVDPGVTLSVVGVMVRGSDQGCIVVQPGADVSLDAVVVEDCGNGSGGGVTVVDATLAVTGSTFRDGRFVPGAGGHVYASGSVVTIADSVLEAGKATTGSAVYASVSDLTLDAVTLTDNDGSEAIYFADAERRAALVVTDSVFTNPAGQEILVEGASRVWVERTRFDARPDDTNRSTIEVLGADEVWFDEIVVQHASVSVRDSGSVDVLRTTICGPRHYPGLELDDVSRGHLANVTLYDFTDGAGQNAMLGLDMTLGTVEQSLFLAGDSTFDAIDHRFGDITYRNNVFADLYQGLAVTQGQAMLFHNAVGDPAVLDQGYDPTAFEESAELAFAPNVSYDADCENDVFVLDAELRFRGAWGSTNPDGSRAHLGPWGGALADGAGFADDDGDGREAVFDCDDSNDDVYPDAPDVCDGVDNDCDGSTDEDGIIAWYEDLDGDGYGDALDLAQCDHPGDGWSHVGGDCDDSDPSFHPEAADPCDSFDQDCSLTADDDPSATPLWYDDLDVDGYGDSTGVFSMCGSWADQVDNGLDCDDTEADANPAATEVCDHLDNDCDGVLNESGGPSQYADRDGDGYGDGSKVTSDRCTLIAGNTYDATDCNDSDASIHPDRTDDCDGRDEDCSGTADDGPYDFFEQWPDQDADSYGDPTGVFSIWDCRLRSGYSQVDTDCDDESAEAHPGADELCNDADDDCDSEVDEGLLVSYFKDDDGDGYGDASSVKERCDGAPKHHVDNDDDCDDGNGDVNPAEAEVCDDVDQDCDGTPDDGLPELDWWPDGDGDGAGDDLSEAVSDCAQPDGYVAVQSDCDDLDANTHLGASETCNGTDEDCDGLVDDGWPIRAWYVDQDVDNYGDATGVFSACAAPESGGFADNPDDCDDFDPAVNPAAVEECDAGGDEDCDGVTACVGDSDADADGWCAGEEGCSDTSVRPGDCDDADPNRNPTVAEICDGVDQNCDGRHDEFLWVDDDGDAFTAVGAGCAPAGPSDCDDDIAAVNPNATEACNGLDDDCDGSVDEDLLVDADVDGAPVADCWGLPVDCDDANDRVHPGAGDVANNGVDDDCDGYSDPAPETLDVDRDGYCAGVACVDGALPGDCDDAVSAAHLDAMEYPDDGVDNDCDGTVDERDDLEDRDGDGSSIEDGDCNDVDASVNPGATETCNGGDDDCDGLVDPDEIDLDGDGVRGCDGDCDDADPLVRPGRAEDCGDGKDNDCNGEVDELADADDDLVTTCGGDCDDDDPAVRPGAAEACNQIDDDCDGSVDEAFDQDADEALDCDACGGSDCDCDDAINVVRPGLAERCGDGLDNDCDGTADQSEDQDGDGWITCRGDCDDDDAFRGPGFPEVCDRRDNDCDGLQDEELDLDGDGWLVCSGDCGEDDAAVYPGASEVCDGADNDCDGQADDDLDCDTDETPEPPPSKDEGCGGCAQGSGGSWLWAAVLLLGPYRSRPGATRFAQRPGFRTP